jgi:hypothetical protein
MTKLQDRKSVFKPQITDIEGEVDEIPAIEKIGIPTTQLTKVGG